MSKQRMNERQLSLLRRIGEGSQPVTSKEPAMATTVYALRNRGLVTTPRVAGVWTAVITDAGRYYLEHGRHPKEDVSQKEESPASRGEVRASPSRLAILPDELIERLVASGGYLQVPDPDPETRAAWRRALHAAKQSSTLPEGRMIWHKGRDAGDLRIELRERPEPQPAWERRERVRIPVPERLGRSHPVVAELKEAARPPKVAGYGWGGYQVERRLRPLDVPRGNLPRALRIMQALITEAERRGHHVHIVDQERRRWRDVCIVVKGHANALTVKERDDRLQVILPDAYVGRRHWTDGPRRSIEDKLGDALAEIESRAEEAEQHRLDQERRQQERQRRWEEAMAAALERFVQDHRAQVLRKQVESWRLARDIRAFCSAIRASAAATGELSGDASAWLEWASSYAGVIDPVLHPPGMPEDPKPTREALQPYLGSWNPYGPWV
jgi:hypothetical protein